MAASTDLIKPASDMTAHAPSRSKNPHCPVTAASAASVADPARLRNWYDRDWDCTRPSWVSPKGMRISSDPRTWTSWPNIDDAST
jgi:hypothetical protein